VQNQGMKRTLLFVLALIAAGCAEPPVPLNVLELVLQGRQCFVQVFRALKLRPFHVDRPLGCEVAVLDRNGPGELFCGFLEDHPHWLGMERSGPTPRYVPL